MAKSKSVYLKNVFPACSDVSHRRYALRGAGQTDAAVAPQGHGVGVRRVDVRLAVGQFHGDQTCLVVGTNPLVGLNERRVQDGFLETHKTVLITGVM